MDNVKISSEYYLNELTQDTPMGRMKLLCFWESLSIDTKIKIIYLIRAKGKQ